ncbi:HlyD family efflux transporter periplasmic adaptor subunit [Flammeovirga sp. MY04]|uniref:efflux RND transporter periplasmic adaptor subunit n=1 Tax=Flammeovirga sp. MY04 TaxID=1191459 RepID=UPI000824C973|nr:HlyD family efflux transporter periplasmic adaptor subunit [Flammeovirga sp. MY04]ANQ50327.2 HlyD family efflux transporter periplasmic adaptor subunit [Flammeovirga sp. MY04]
MKIKHLYLILSPVIIATAFFAVKALPEKKEEAPNEDKSVIAVNVEYAELQTLQNNIEVTGKLKAKDRYEIYAEVEGRLLPSAKKFREGNYYKKGQVLLQIDQQERYMTLLADKSNFMTELTAILPDLKEDFSESYPTWNQYLKELDIKKPLKVLPEPKTEKEKYFIAGNGIYSSYYTIKSSEEKLSKYTIYAPFSGVISKSDVEAGTAVRAGQELGEMVNLSSYELEVTAPLKNIEHFKKGNKVKLYSSELDSEWTGTVIRIGNTLDANSQSVKVYIQTSGKDLKEGMFLMAQVNSAAYENAMLIPRKLIFNDNQVYVVKDNKLEVQEIEVMETFKSDAIVKGVPTKTAVLMTNIKNPYTGMKVQVLN